MLNFNELTANWDGAGVFTQYDAPTGAWIYIALHSNVMGIPTGGTRMRVYDAPEEGLLDAMRLARGMTHKWASINLPYGGGKAVLALSRPLDAAARKALLGRYAQVLNLLNGAFMTGEDLGTTPADMKFIAELSPHCMGKSDEGEALDPGPYTAQGVFAAIKAVAKAGFGGADLSSLSVLIQGVGDVGGPLAQLLADAGVRLIFSDVNADLVQEKAAALGATVSPPDQVYETECDIFAPCAIGAVLNSETIPLLKCKAVAGSANNQLREEEDAARLHQRGILYAPDYVANAAGALAFGLMNLGQKEDAVLYQRIAQLEDILTEIFIEAVEHDASPLNAAVRRVDRVLASRTEV